MADNDRQDPWLGEPRDPAAQPVGPAGRGGNGAGPGHGDSAWTRDVLERLAFSSIREQRRARRWGIFFKLLFFSYLVLLLVLYWPGNFRDDGFRGNHTALIEIRGVIAEGQDASADNIISGLRRAFGNKDAEAIILRINSPGGSPVQAGYVNDEIVRLRGLHPDKKLYAVVTDICASGGYYIAVGADEIYADKASIVGSIGVLIDGFGFVDTLEKLGVERRLITAGESKGFLDPFSPLKEEDVDHVRAMLDEVHRQFISVVREGRGDRLKGDDQTLFTGLTWTGEESLKLGLVDGLGSSSFVARELVGAERIVDYTYRRPVFERFADRIGLVLANVVMNAFRGEIR
jgi:protease IV